MEINISFFEAFDKMSLYQKFMKEVLSKKRSIEDEQVPVDEILYAITRERKILVKQKHLGFVAISCTLKYKTFKRVLIGSSSSVSLMPLSIFKKLGIEKINESGTN